MSFNTITRYYCCCRHGGKLEWDNVRGSAVFYQIINADRDDFYFLFLSQVRTFHSSSILPSNWGGRKLRLATRCARSVFCVFPRDVVRASRWLYLAYRRLKRYAFLL